MEENQIIISEEYGNTEEITQNVVNDNIEIDDIENPSVGVTESQDIISDTNDMTIHNNLHDRDVDDAHPISAISNLRQELDALNTSKTPQTIYSDKDVYASYYTWVDGAKSAQFGHFVSLVDNTTNIQLCSGKNAFGVTIDKAKAAIVGNYDISKYNEDTHALVATSGLVEVRYIGNVQVGDYVVPYIVLGEEDIDGAGMAKKSDSGYGYLVVALDNIGTAPCATIAFNIPADQIDDIGVNIQYLDERMDSAEIRINDAQITAAEALQKANETFNSNQITSDKVDNAIDYVSNATTSLGTEIGELRQNVEKTKNDFMITAQNNLAEAKKYANTKWEEAENNRKEGEEDLRTKIGEESALLRGYADAKADEAYSLITSIDMYSVGEYSQTYGLTLSQARTLLKPGMVYIPTKHGDNNTHTEEYTFTNKDTIPPTETAATYKFEDVFTYGKYYVWDDIDRDVASGDNSLSIDGYWWDERARGIAFDLLTVPTSPTIDLWYTLGEVSDGLKAAGYESYTLYKRKDETWERVNALVGNVNNRLTSMIRHSANQIGLEVISARGSITSIDARLTETNSQVSALTQWKGKADTKIAGIQSVADEASASVAQIAGKIRGEYTIIEDSWLESDKDIYTVYYSKKDEKYYYYNNGEWKGTKYPSEAGLQYDAASIIASINGDDTAVTISADRIAFMAEDYEAIAQNIKFDGTMYVTNSQLQNGTTIINGACIQTGEIKSANYERYCISCNAGWTLYLPNPNKESQGLKLTLLSDDSGYYIESVGSCQDAEVVIPSSYNGKPVTAIGPLAFEECDTIRTVIIPDTVKAIADEAFWGCPALDTLIIGDGVVSIGESAFANCWYLSTIVMPNMSSYRIPESAFEDLQFDLLFKGSQDEFDSFNSFHQNPELARAPVYFYGEEWEYGIEKNKNGSCLNLVDGSFTTPNFKLDSKGKITATEADIQGKVTADDGEIGGWDISEGEISSGNLHFISSEDSEYRIMAGEEIMEDKDYNISLQHSFPTDGQTQDEELYSYYWNLEYEGITTIESIEIISAYIENKYDINITEEYEESPRVSFDNRLKKYNIQWDLYRHPGWLKDYNARFNIHIVGKLSRGHSFAVTKDGILHASGANITGSGSFTGTVYATDGEFIGKVHATDGIFKGTVYATEGEFKGTLEAGDGHIGSFTIGGNGIWSDDRSISLNKEFSSIEASRIKISDKAEISNLNITKICSPDADFAPESHDAPFIEFERAPQGETENVVITLSAKVTTEGIPGTIDGTVLIALDSNYRLFETHKFIVNVPYFDSSGNVVVSQKHIMEIPRGGSYCSITIDQWFGDRCTKTDRITVVSGSMTFSQPKSAFSTNDWMNVNVNGHLIPYLPLVYNLGNSDYTWGYVYHNHDACGSDIKIKDNIVGITSDFSQQLINGLTPKSYTLKAAKTPRTHYGFIAQEVEELLYSLGTSPDEVGIVCKSKPGEPDGEDNRYSLNYIDLIAPMVSVIQQQSKKIEELEERLNKIEGLLNNTK